MVPHHEILEKAATFGDDAIGLLSFISSEIPQITTSEDCLCLWCTHKEDNPLIVFKDLQKQMVDSSRPISHTDDMYASDSTEPAEDTDLPATTSANTPLALTSNLLSRSTPTQGAEVIEGLDDKQPSNTQIDHVPEISTSTSTSTLQEPVQQPASLTHPQSTPPPTVYHERKRVTSRPIDHYAILTKERRRREEQRANSQTSPKKRKKKAERDVWIG